MPSPPDRITDCFCPSVLTYASPGVDTSLAEHGLTTVPALLAPVQTVPNVSVRWCSNYEAFILRSFRIEYIDYTHAAEGGVPVHSDELFVDKLSEDFARHVAQKSDRPYEFVRDRVLHRRSMRPYETFEWPMACLILVSTADSDPLATLQNLWQQVAKDNLYAGETTGLTAFPDVVQWANPDILRYIVLVDSGGSQPADALLADIKREYGAHCTVLNPAGDVLSLQKFTREFVCQSFVPWIERTVAVLNEQYQDKTKRSLGGRFFRYLSVSSRVGGDDGSGSPHNNQISPRGFYHHTALDSQNRRLADMAFIMQDYKLAEGVYEQLVKDFKNRQAWKYYGSAMFMLGLTRILLSHSRPLAFNPDEYLAIISQLPHDTSVFDFFLIKAVFVYFDMYDTVGDWRYAPASLLRGSSLVVSAVIYVFPDAPTKTHQPEEFLAPLFIEQAAKAFLKLPRPAYRRFAFYMTLAAGKYERCGVKSLSRYCLSEASKVYDGSQALTPARLGKRLRWQSVHAYVHYSLGRQAYNLGENDVAIAQFLTLLPAPNCAKDTTIPALSRQPSDASNENDSSFISEADKSKQHWLTDLTLAWENLPVEKRALLLEEQANVKSLIRIINHDNVKLRIASQTINGEHTADDASWERLGNALEPIQESVHEYHHKHDTASKVHTALQHEKFYLDVLLENPISTDLTIGKIRVLLSDSATNGDVVIEDPGDIVLSPFEQCTVSIPITINGKTAVTFSSISYEFNNIIPCSEALYTKTNNKTTNLKQPYTLLTPGITVFVMEPVPVLDVDQSRSDMDITVYAGQLSSATLQLKNIGGSGITHIRGTTDHPHVFMMDDSNCVGIIDGNTFSAENKVSLKENKLITGTFFTVDVTTLNVPLRVHAQDSGRFEVKFLFRYTSLEQKTHDLHVKVSLHVIPSLTIVPSMKRGSHLEYEILLTVKNDNMREGKIDLTRIWSLGREWKLDGTLKNPIPVPQCQHSYTGMWAIQPTQNLTERQLVAENSDLVQKMDEFLSGKQIESTTPDSVLLQYGDGTNDMVNIVDIVQNHSYHKMAALSQYFCDTGLSTEVLAKLFPLYTHNSLDVVVDWELTFENADPPVKGFLILPDLCVGEKQAPFGFDGVSALSDILRKAALSTHGVYAETQHARTRLIKKLMDINQDEGLIIEQVVSTTEEAIDNESHVSHDFKNGPLLLYIAFSLKNSSRSSTVDSTIDLSFRENNKLPLVYIGPLTLRATVSPSTMTRLTSKALIMEPGKYELGSYSVTTLLSDSSENKNMYKSASRPLWVRAID